MEIWENGYPGKFYSFYYRLTNSERSSGGTRNLGPAALADPDSPIGGATLPPLPSPAVPFPFPPISFPFPSLPLEVGLLNTARGYGECCELSQRGLRRSPSGNRIWRILALKSDIWWHQFYYFSWESIVTRASCLVQRQTRSPAVARMADRTAP